MSFDIAVFTLFFSQLFVFLCVIVKLIILLANKKKRVLQRLFVSTGQLWLSVISGSSVALLALEVYLQWQDVACQYGFALAQPSLVCFDELNDLVFQVGKVPLAIAAVFIGFCTWCLYLIKTRSKSKLPAA